MKGGSKLFLIAGVGLAVVAVALLLSGMSGKNKKADATNDQETTKVTVVEAVVAIPAHTQLTAENLLEVQVLQSEAPADAVTSKADVLGKAYRVPLVQGQRLVSTQVETPGLGNEVAEGKRAISIPASQLNLFSGLIQDGDYIDVVFHARINTVRLLPTDLAEFPEDKASYEWDVLHGAVILTDPSADDASNSGNGNDDSNKDSGSGDAVTDSLSPISWVGSDVSMPEFPAVGDPGSKFLIRDGVGDDGQLEPVAKIMVQDIKVLRVVRPGQTFDLGGAETAGTADGDNLSSSSTDSEIGYLVLEVTPEQAEALTFMEDSRHTFQVIVRAKDDHAIAETPGITFQILATDEDYGLPWPKSVTAPKEQAASRSSSSRANSSEDDKDS